MSGLNITTNDARVKDILMAAVNAVVTLDESAPHTLIIDCDGMGMMQLEAFLKRPMIINMLTTLLGR